jgi:cell division inhibitor SulA
MNLATVWNLRGLWPGYGGQARRRLSALRPAKARHQPGPGRREASLLSRDNETANEAITGRSAASGPRSVAVSTQPAQAASAHRGALTEICTLQSSDGREESAVDSGLQHMLPALAGMCNSRWLVLVAPPEIPSVRQFRAAGIDPSRVLLVHPRAAKGLSVMERALCSGTCGAVLVWLQQRDGQTLQRLRLAAETGRCWGVMFRPSARTADEAPAQIELGLSS